MKTEYLFVILLVLIGFSSCEDSTSDATLELSQSTFENISSDGATLTVNITSSGSWTAASSSTACNPVPNQGTSNQSLSIVVEANLDEAERNMTVVVTSGGIKKTISISQQGRSTTAGEYHYNLPVIFHVLYKDKNNPLQYVKQDRLAKILDTVNKLYKDNSLFINDQSTSTQYSTADITVTLAHELGHYLGLHHAFSENDEGIYDGCFDSDYCDDTPTYNKVEYDADYAYTAKNDPANFTFDYLVKRKNCKTNQTFTSTNIMDYSVSYSDRFTNDQRSRIRHVLTYSPLIPGPKQGQTQTRSVVEGPIDLPIRTAR
ncbi:M43 family zinc metalloprotease [Bacteroides fragilis]